MADTVTTAAEPARRHPFRRRWLLAIGAGYLMVLHAVLAVLVVKTDFRERLERRLGDIVPHGEFDSNYRRWAAAFAMSDARARPGALVFIGDSIMRDLDTSSIARHTINMAIPGDTTARVLKRMERYRSVKTARGVVLGVGVNDIGWRPIPEILDNYRQILALVPAGTSILVIAVLPVDERAQRLRQNAEVRRLNAALADLCASRPGCHFVNPAPELLDDTGNLAANAHDGDGLHLSNVGHDIYWNALNSAVLTYMPAANPTPPAQ